MPGGGFATAGKVVASTGAGGVLMISATLRARLVVATLVLASLSWLPNGICSAALVTVVNETFDGYTSFPNMKPPNDPVNFGVPLTGEGADSNLWLAARFEAGGNGAGNTINTDVSVQESGSIIAGQNDTPVGRAGDGAGLVLRLDLTGITNVTLDFDWRTYIQDAADDFVVAYYVGDGTADQPGGLGNPNGVFDWFNDPQLGNGSMTWYNNNWTELLRASPNDLYTHSTFPLPGNSVVYLAFWNDDGSSSDNELDFGKFDNVVVRGEVVPEPASFVLLGFGLLATSFRRRRSAR
jgi:hypothetical protein